MSFEKYSVVIIGSGPAGHTAAIYAARAKLNPLMLEGEMAGGVAAGGQLTTTTDVENFPGFPDGISGPELMIKMREQSEKYGTKIITKTVDEIDLNVRPFKIKYSDKTIQSKTIIIATGATAKKLSAKGTDEFWQKGISACAVCDGALPMFRNKPLVVIGGGDSAVEESCYLTKFASEVHVLVRRDALRASKVMQERLFSNNKITVHWNTVLEEACGNQMLQSVKVKNTKTNSVKSLAANGLFYAIGHEPNTKFLNNQIECDETGYIKTKPGTTYTSIPGVFACGDVQDKVYRQAISAAGTGCMAALEAEKYIVEHPETVCT